MKTSFTKEFNKSLREINDKKLAITIEEIIEKVEMVKSALEIPSIKKLKGHKAAYRIKTGRYRIGLFIEDNEAIFAAIAHRKDIYRKFP